MDAIISGRAGVAFLFEGEVLSSFDVEDPDTLLPRRPADLRLIFGEATDIELFEDVDHAEAAHQLERAFNCASALDLTLILFDPELTDDVRDDAAAELERLLSDPKVTDYLENILYGRPLPASADVTGARARCKDGPLPKLSALLEILEGYQPAILEVCAAWDDIPVNLFGGGDHKAEFQHVAVREGLFRRLALEVANGPRARIGDFTLHAGLNRSVTSLRNHRQVLQQWLSPFHSRTTAPRVRHEVEEFINEPSVTRRGKRAGNKRRGADEELAKIQGQINLIVKAMRERNLAFARKIIDEVIDYQLRTTKPIHAAKTLCSLASEARDLGIHSLQLELTERAIQVAPDDGWSWAQHADALLKSQRLAETLRAYEQAESFGVGTIAKRGRAEVLKASGRLNDALAAYDAVLAEDEMDVIAKNGRAETLRAMGRLQEALEAYDSAVAGHPENAVARSGRAETLRAMGRLPEALEAYDSAIAQHPEDVVAKTGRAETLRALGRLPEALEAYDSAIAQHPENVVAKTGRAETLRALGRLPEALEAYNSAIAQHPENVVAKNGRAETLRAMGRLPEALEAYDSAIAQHPENVVARSGRAETLRALGRLPEALEAYDSAIAQHPENVVAKNGRAETLRAMGRLPEALEAYDSAIAQHPEDVVARSGRAETLRALGRLPEALEAYDSAIAQHPENVVAKTGRAETLRAMGRLPEALEAYDSAIAQHPEDVVARSGRAETLRAMSRLPEALATYDSAIAQHPENVVAKNGRAETLRAMGRLPEALEAYDSAIAQHPENVVARSGRSCVLVALRRYDEALQHLPVNNPFTLDDWIGYHIRGMILLRTNRVEEAIQIFEHGAKENPIPSSREYFQNALAVAYLRRGDFAQAGRFLENVTAPLLQPQANVGRLHAYGASGDYARAATAYEGLREKPWTISNELVAELHRRYMLKEEPQHDDEWVSDQEINMILSNSGQQMLSSALLA